MKQLWLEKQLQHSLWMALVFLFLYLPLLFMVLFSFNSTRQDAEFTGFSLRWYEALTRDNKIVDGFWLSLKVAFHDRRVVGRVGHLCGLCAGALPQVPGAHACFRAW
jgi:ABC-type spermidine/putrescine transport system permease subunit II